MIDGKDNAINLMRFSYNLKNHMIINEKLSYKIKYLNALEYFACKYSRDNVLNLKVLGIYKKVFLKDDVDSYLYEEEKAMNILKSILKTKLRGFKFFSYRYLFFLDCLILNSKMNCDIGNSILSYSKYLYKEKYHKNLDEIFTACFDSSKVIKLEALSGVSEMVGFFKQNKEFLNKNCKKIIVTANMSAGKSTFINSLVGKNISRTMNDSCTKKIHYIYNKYFDDHLVCKKNVDVNLYFNEDINLSEDKECGEDIEIASYFNFISGIHENICIIDTPGINSVTDLDKGEDTKNLILTQEFDKLIYLLNSENLGTNDEKSYLNFIYKNVEQDKIIFILNKLDKFRTKEDSIEKSIESLRTELLNIGFENPIICPISAYVGILGKKILIGEKMNEDQADEYIYLKRKFKKLEYDLSQFYPLEILKVIDEKFDFKGSDLNVELLKKCGILCLEEMIVRGVSDERSIY